MIVYLFFTADLASVQSASISARLAYFDRGSLRAQALFDMLETLDKLAIGFLKGILRIHFEEACKG
jgi:hypothetical protein